MDKKEIKSFELIEEFKELKKFEYLLSMDYDEFKRIMNLRHKYDNNYKNEDERKETFKSLKKYCMETINNNLINKVIWKKSKCGRFYSSNSIQNQPREFKNFVTDEIMTDIDIKNSQPTILLNICKKYGISCVNLEKYCNNRNEILEETKLHKTIFTASINYNKRLTKIKNKIFNEYDKEIKNIQKELLKRNEFKELIDDIGEDINLEGKLMNKIYFNFETEIILILKSLLESKDYKIAVYSYDGLMIYGDHYKNNELLKYINKEINEYINFDYKLTILFKEPEKIIRIPEDWKGETSYRLINEDETDKKVNELQKIINEFPENYFNSYKERNELCIIIYNETDGNNEGYKLYIETCKLLKNYNENECFNEYNKKTKKMKKDEKSKGKGTLIRMLNTYKEDVLEKSDKEDSFYNKLLHTTIKYQTHNDLAEFFNLELGKRYKKLDDYYLYFNNDNIWERDNDGTFIRNAISKEFLKPYFEMIELNNKLYASGSITDEQKEEIKIKNKNIGKLINNLKNRSFKTSVFKEIGDKIKDNNFIDDMNKKINYLPIKNKKMLNIETLNIEERTEKFKFNYYCNVDFIELTTEEEYEIENYFNKLFCDDYETREIFINIIKTVFCGRILKNLFILVGDGSNGKSLLFEILKAIFGKAIMTLSTDIIILNKNKGSINSEFKKLEECRAGYITEVGKKDKINSPLAKKITGNDALDYRGLYQENRDLKPTSNLFVLTNELPKIPSDNDGKVDKALINRLITIPFNNHFKNDNTFVDKMMSKLDLIFSYIMRKGNIIKDVEMSANMKEYLKEYIEDNIKEDPLEEFINEIFEKVEILENEKWTLKSIKRDEFINLYENYLEDNNLPKNTLSKKKLTETLKKNYKINNNESHSVKYYMGLKLKTKEE